MKIWQLLFGISFFLSTASVAQESSNVVLAPKQIPQEAQLLAMAGKLVSYGHQTKSAMPLIQAIQIYRQLDVVDDASNDTTSPFSETQILADATKYADGNRNLLALIKETANTTRATKNSRVGGPHEPPLRIFRFVAPNETREHKVSISADQFIQVLVDGQGEGIREKDKEGNVLASDLRLTVLDGQGRTLAIDNSMGENCSVSFIARTSSTMTVEVKNVGKLSDRYVLYVYRQ